MTTTTTIRVAELFAGVGGFRLGLEGYKGKSASSGYTQMLDPMYQVVWSNQWEPLTNIQHASHVYEHVFGSDNHTNVDIATVKGDDIPDIDMLVGGFPCQDYSVARPSWQSKGIEGKKGVLWWEIYRILDEMGERRPALLLLENVDRLLKSPSKQRGRDFAIILASLDMLGYRVEWRVINAADYGMPQRRRRVFIIGYRIDMFRYPNMSDMLLPSIKNSIMMKAFPGTLQGEPVWGSIAGDLSELTKIFNESNPQTSPFLNAGLTIGRRFCTYTILPSYDGRYTTLGDILQPLEDVSVDFHVEPKDMKRWMYLKGTKREERTRTTGESYIYSEGALPFPDDLDKPGRTIVTGEGGSGPSRLKHVVEQGGLLRRLTPVELERLNMFPDNHTKTMVDMQEVSPNKRAFFMGNALVVGVIEKIGLQLFKLYRGRV